MQPLGSNYSLVLKDIDLEIPEGLCVAIIGTVGAGKSSLLNCLLGELYYEPGTSVSLRGPISYVSQKPWINSMTVKDVILFGSPLKQAKFDLCVKLACLEDDLKTMTQGIDTMLGDRGVNLSGGQKTRVAIARALYAEKDIYLFDDPISALDVNVGKLVMEEAILKHLKGKTRLVATHALNYLPYFDRIIVMDQGRIVEVGGWDTIKDSQVYLDFKKNMEREHQKDGEPADGSVRNSLRDRTSLGRRRSTKKSLESEIELELTKKKSSMVEEQLKKSVATGIRTKADEIIDSIISSEDKSKGDVVTKELLGKYVSAAGGSWFLWPLFIGTVGQLLPY